jgi:predicted AAA+ superfamily ATPase
VYARNDYLKTARPFLGKPVVKVFTGMRRVGKSCLVRLLIDDLLKDGVAKERIVYVDKESYAFDAIRDYHDLAAYVAQALPPDGQPSGQRFIFVDEIQEIDGWERIVADWSGQPSLDVTITGSNARMLSGKLATLLAGRYVEIPVFPLSFTEFRQFHGAAAGENGEAFRNYLRFGGLPGLHELGALNEETFRPFVSGIFDTVVLRDIVQRHQARNHVMLERVLRYVFDNIGNLINASKIAAFLKSQHLKVGVDTVVKYLDWFTEARLTHRLPLYDLRGKRHLEINEKHYVSDLGLRFFLLGYRAGDIGQMLENVVCLELLRRRYRVSAGRMGEQEIDFVGERDGERLYVQVAYLF